jgi:hypothetical protein
MRCPAFFDEVARIALRDPLAELLGAVEGGLITGAAGAGGFKGMGGKFARRDLLAFEAPLNAEMRFTRQDTGASVAASYHSEVVAPTPDMRELLPGVLSGQASTAERMAFGRLWQDRVRRILIDHFDDPALVVFD